MASFLLVGFGRSNQSLARALVDLGADVCAYDDRPGPDAEAVAQELGVELHDRSLEMLVGSCDYVLPTPGLADSHKLFDPKATKGNVRDKLLSELDVFAAHDPRPYVAITGTNGKTTVAYLVQQMLEQSGIAAVAAGNADPIGVSLGEAMVSRRAEASASRRAEASADRPAELVVVEVSSFQLRFARAFAPSVAAWLNFAPDHLDVHASLLDYETSKAKIWQLRAGQLRSGRLPSDQLSAGDFVAVANLDDDTVMSHLPSGISALKFSRRQDQGSAAEFARQDSWLTALGEPFQQVEQMPRRQPHDISNALAAAAVATSAGASIEAAAKVLREFAGLKHRLCLIANAGGVEFYDDSKSTSPHSTISAVDGFASVVLIAGGQNKGLDLSPMANISDKLRAVVTLGETAGELEQIFAGRSLVVPAVDMASAVSQAQELAERGDVVLLSPGCASFDMYGSYKERGADFAAQVERVVGGVQ